MKNNNTSRRNFLKKSAITTGVAAIGSFGLTNNSFAAGTSTNKLPREVWVAGISQEGLKTQTSQSMVDELIRIFKEVAVYRPDIVCLPENFPFSKIEKKMGFSEKLESSEKALQQFQSLAKQYSCYIICPLYTSEGNKAYNAAVIFDRQGSKLGEYRKIHLTEGEIEKGLTPGPTDPPVFKTDFGVIGMQICYDLQFFDGFKKLGEKGAEMIFWSSAYCGGKALNAVAWMNRFVVVASTRYDPSKICDIDGSDMDSSAYRSRHWVCQPVNLEKVLIKKWPHINKFNDIIKKYGRKVKIKILEEEVWAVVESLSPDVNVANVLNEFEIEGFRDLNDLAEKMYKTHRIHP